MKDHALKIFFKRSENFAAIFNTFRPDISYIDEDNLSDYDTASQLSFKDKEGKNISREIVRDIIKKTDGKVLSLYGIENQSYIDYNMPARVFLYDAATTAQQAFKKKKKDKILPVISIVLYFGVEPWDGPKSVLEMTDLPKELWDRYQDYRIQVVDIRRLSREDLDKLPGDLAYFFEFMQMIAKKEEFEDFIRETSGRISALREDTLLALNSFVGVDSEIEGGDTMKGEFQKVLDYIGDKKLKEGKILGIREGQMEAKETSSKYFKEQMELAGFDPVKVEEILKGFENTK